MKIPCYPLPSWAATFCRLAAVILLAALCIGCSAKAKQARAAKRADNYFAQGEFEKAKIEYLNVVRSDPLNQVAIERLGLIWSEQGSPIRALPLLNKAK